jgi:ANTAR domain
MHSRPRKLDNTFAVDTFSGPDGEAAVGGVPRDEMTAAVANFVEHRSAIEQTKGMLMLLYGIDESAAFELLKWRSQQNNVKLRLLAERIATDFLALSSGETLPSRSAFDKVLLTAHLRIDAESQLTDGAALPHSDAVDQLSRLLRSDHDGADGRL